MENSTVQASSIVGKTGNQLVTEVKENIDKVGSESVPASKAPDPEHLSLLQLQNLILSNCAVLWLALQYREHYITPVCPDFVIFTARAKNAVCASIHYDLPSFPKPYMLIRGPGALTHHGAYQELLEMTEEILAGTYGNELFHQGGTQEVKPDGGGVYYARKR